MIVELATWKDGELRTTLSEPFDRATAALEQLSHTPSKTPKNSRIANSLDQGDTLQAKVTVRGPTAANPELFHDGKPVCVGQGEVLIGELLHDATNFGQFGPVEGADGQPRQGVDEREELNGAALVVTPEEPPMPLRDNER
jgi:hypothetical protein